MINQMSICEINFMSPSTVIFNFNTTRPLNSRTKEVDEIFMTVGNVMTPKVIHSRPSIDDLAVDNSRIIPILLLTKCGVLQQIIICSKYKRPIANSCFK